MWAMLAWWISMGIATVLGVCCRCDGRASADAHSMQLLSFEHKVAGNVPWLSGERLKTDSNSARMQEFQWKSEK